jgi:hypothetical protein
MYRIKSVSEDKVDIQRIWKNYEWCLMTFQEN